MNIEPLAISGAWLCTPKVHADERGSFLEWFRGDLLAQATGHRFAVVQANHSVSRRGVVRGVHFADVPPGQAKYVYCARGAVLDVVVDVRAGSPTFGQSVCVTLDESTPSGVFIAEGLGHAFCALRDDSSVVYLQSSTYQPDVERAVNPLDPALALPWADHVEDPVCSPRDAAAPSLSEALTAGTLPSYEPA